RPASCALLPRRSGSAYAREAGSGVPMDRARRSGAIARLAVTSVLALLAAPAPIYPHGWSVDGTGAAISSMIRCGDTGCSLRVTAKLLSASSIAEITQAVAGIVPPSPAPLTPSGL